MVSAALKAQGIAEVMIHTGQHYDYEMSALFFEQLGLSEPAHNLGVGSDSHGAQTARILAGVEQVLLRDRPDLLVVYGDTNSTLAGALAAAKLAIPVGHVEAGLRSFNKAMPEEINRVLTDHVSDLLLVPTELAVENLRREGIAGEHVVLTGDVMYDAVLTFRALYERERARVLRDLEVEENDYFVATIHRAENTDQGDRLAAIVAGLSGIAAELAPVVWPIHPRTRNRLTDLGIGMDARVLLAAPVGYIEMQALVTGARGVLTDSGGLQKEAAFHGVPTLTLRDETEWPETVVAGCNVLVGADVERMVTAARAIDGRRAPPTGFGRGDAASRIAATIHNWKTPATTTQPPRPLRSGSV
jgi:UDP-N-acetylglucosamine 2-epimerase